MIIKNIQKHIATHDELNILISGGTSPKKILNYFNNYSLKWEKVNIMLSDERLLDKNSSESNEKNLKINLIKNKSKSVNYIDINNFVLPDNFDIGILGFGEDGHIASIFNKHIKSKKLMSQTAKREILKIEPIGQPCVARITVNMSVLLKIKHIYLISNSKNKTEIFKRAKNDPAMPLHRLLKIHKKIQFIEV